MPCRVVILGAGISGLSCAWFLKKKWGDKVQATILEKSDRVGGWMRTVRQEGFLFEKGPRSFRPKGNGLCTLELIEALGLQDQVIKGESASCDRYLYADQQLQKLPSSFFECLFSPLMKGVFPALIRDLLAAKSQEEDESVHRFFSRRLSSRLADLFVDPLISGIYAGDSRRLSLKACFPLFHQFEQEQGSLIKGLLKRKKTLRHPSAFVNQMKEEKLLSFIQGMETLPQALAKQAEADIHLNARVQDIQIEANKLYLTGSFQETIEADYVISALPIPGLIDIFSFYPDLLSSFHNIPYATVGVVNLGYRGSILSKKGFGYLVPHQEKEDILGCVWDSCVFPEQNRRAEDTRLTVMMGGTLFPNSEALTEQACVDIALRSVRKHLGVHGLPDAISSQVIKQAIPQYVVGYHDTVAAIYKRIASLSPRLVLAGNAFNGVAVNDCVAHAKTIGDLRIET